MRLARLAGISADVAGTPARNEKRALLAAGLKEARPGEIVQVVHYLGGRLPQGRIGLGAVVLRRLASRSEPPLPAGLELAEVDQTFAEIARLRGPGSARLRENLLGTLFARASSVEREFLTRLILGDLRQGALEGVLAEAVAEAARIDVAELRRAVMIAGELAEVARVVLTEGRAGLAHFRLKPFVAVHPMLAQPASDIDEALRALGEAAFEYKIDGARVQIHKTGAEIGIYSRGLNDVTSRMPEIVAAARRWPAHELIVDGEVIAFGNDGRPAPFQVTLSRFGRKTATHERSAQFPLTVCLFDCLYRDGEELIELSGRERHAHLEAGADPRLSVPRLVTSERAAAEAFLACALAAGHEGVMAKSLAAPYRAGNRGGDWLKVKIAHTLDLVVLAAEWGNGRRRGWLSNLHLGAFDPSGEGGRFVMLGKTFKGLTDAMLAWQTSRLLELETRREGNVVWVQPELVVEIAVNQIQASCRYPTGMALRFARVRRYREDKAPDQADTVSTVRALFERQR